jgi:PTH1 family peptidyl-tRNA hydrolase
MKGKGSDGGHNGLKDIQAVLNSQEYARLRFGVGNDFPKGRQSDYVLGKWNPEEVVLLSERIDVASEAVKSFVNIGLNLAMTQWNNK